MRIKPAIALFAVTGLFLLLAVCLLMFFYQQNNLSTQDKPSYELAMLVPKLVSANSMNNDATDVAINSMREAVKTPSFSTADSLQGTSPPQGLLYNQDKQLIINKALHDVFLYYFSSFGEEDLNQIKNNIISHLQAALPEPARSQAMQLLDDYIAAEQQIADYINYHNQQSDTSSPASPEMALRIAQAMPAHMQHIIDIKKTRLRKKLTRLFLRLMMPTH